MKDARVVHLNHYLPSLDQARKYSNSLSVAVIGGSQSAVEILLHASTQNDIKRLVGVTRNFGFRQKDTSPFSDEVYFPEFVDTFYEATPENKARLRRELVHTNYSSADIDVLNQLYIKQYENKLSHQNSMQILTCNEIVDCRSISNGIFLKSRNFINSNEFEECFDLVVLATGFLDLGTGERQEFCPKLLLPIKKLLTNQGDILSIGRDYRVQYLTKGDFTPIYLNGLCESTHGMGDAGSFSLLALRSKTIVDSLSQYLS